MTAGGLGAHLVQSTLWLLATAVVALALGRQRARLRYAVWLSASLKFLVPFSLLAALGAGLAPAAAHPHPPPAAWAQWAGARSPLALPARLLPLAPASPPPDPWPARGLVLLWACGSAAVGLRWLQSWCRLRALARQAQPLSGAPSELPVRVVEAPLEPGVFGIFRPVLLVPADLARRLSPEQWQALCAHERCHLERRDNLTAAVHMLVEMVFWFHPLAWWLRGRLVAERERACDEAVLEAGGDAADYATLLVEVSRYVLNAPLACAAGMSGGSLQRRVHAILSHPSGEPGRAPRWLTVAAAAALALPLWAGFRYAPRARQKPQLQFDVVSIRPGNSDLGNGRRGSIWGGVYGSEWRAQNVNLLVLIDDAYGLPFYQLDRVLGATHWFQYTMFDVTATIPAHTTRDQIPLMIRAMLADRFHLVMHQETRMMAAVAITVAPGGAKLVPDPACSQQSAELSGDKPACGNWHLSLDGDTVVLAVHGMTMAELANSHLMQAPQYLPVVDRTGLTGAYDFTVRLREVNERGVPRDQWPGIDAQNLAWRQAAILQQLGLKVNLTRPSQQPVPVWVVDRATLPTPN